MNPLEWLQYTVLGNTLLAWGTAAAVFIGVWLVLGILRKVMQVRLQTIAERHAMMPLRIAENTARYTKGWFLFLVAVLLGSRFLEFPADIGSLLTKAAT